MRDSDLTRLGRVLELVMRPDCVYEVPAIGFDLFDKVCAVHVCNYTQHKRARNI